MYQYFIPFNGWIIFHWILLDGPHLFIPSFTNEHLACFHLLVIVNNSERFLKNDHEFGRWRKRERIFKEKGTTNSRAEKCSYTASPLCTFSDYSWVSTQQLQGSFQHVHQMASLTRWKHSIPHYISSCSLCHGHSTAVMSVPTTQKLSSTSGPSHLQDTGRNTLLPELFKASFSSLCKYSLCSENFPATPECSPHPHPPPQVTWLSHFVKNDKWLFCSFVVCVFCLFGLVLVFVFGLPLFCPLFLHQNRISKRARDSLNPQCVEECLAYRKCSISNCLMNSWLGVTHWRTGKEYGGASAKKESQRSMDCGKNIDCVYISQDASLCQPYSNLALELLWFDYFILLREWNSYLLLLFQSQHKNPRRELILRSDFAKGRQNEQWEKAEHLCSLSALCGFRQII